MPDLRVGEGFPGAPRFDILAHICRALQETPPGTYNGEGPAVRFTLTREKLQGFVDGLKREWAEVVERNKDVMAPTRQGVQPHS